MKNTIGIIFGFIAAASLAFFTWAPIEIIQLWNSAVVAQASTQGTLSLAELAQAMFASIPTLYVLLAVYWINTGFWAFGLVFIMSTAVSIAVFTKE